MNLYFLVEGEKTELQIYPQWLKHLIPELSLVKYPQDAKENNYYLISGMGSPRILTDELEKSVEDVNKFGNYDYLILVLDADEMSTEEKIAEVNQFIRDEKIDLKSCQLQIIVQKYCMETWFLGNRKVYPRNTDNHDFLSHAQFYDVSQQDPELMQKPDSFLGSTSIYHELYLRKMLAAKNIRYKKSEPNEVGEKYYLDELNKRITETPHLSSLKSFFSFCESLSI